MSDQEIYIYGCPSIVGTGVDPNSPWYDEWIPSPKKNIDWTICTNLPVMPEVKINLLPGAQIPTKAHKDDAGYDLYLYEDIELPPGKVVFARTGIKISIPSGYEAQIRPRSGLSTKQKIMVINSPGTIDVGFCNEVLVALVNMNQSEEKSSSFVFDPSSHYHLPAETIVLQKGQRIAQMIFNKVETARFLVVDELEETERGEGGFGSTGK